MTQIALISLIYQCYLHGQLVLQYVHTHGNHNNFPLIILRHTLNIAILSWKIVSKFKGVFIANPCKMCFALKGDLISELSRKSMLVVTQKMYTDIRGHNTGTEMGLYPGVVWTNNNKLRSATALVFKIKLV
jgi:hypothetical protein